MPPCETREVWEKVGWSDWTCWRHLFMAQRYIVTCMLKIMRECKISTRSDRAGRKYGTVVVNRKWGFGKHQHTTAEDQHLYQLQLIRYSANSRKEDNRTGRHRYLLLCIVDQLVFLCEFSYQSPICWRHSKRSAPSYLVDLPVIILVVISRGLTWTLHFQYMEIVQTVSMGTHTLARGQRRHLPLPPCGKCPSILVTDCILAFDQYFHAKTLDYLTKV